MKTPDPATHEEKTYMAAALLTEHATPGRTSWTSRAWWHVRMAGHALLRREWESDRVQRTVRERFPNV